MPPSGRLLKAQLRYGRIETIFAEGLHEFLTGMITRTAELGAEIDAFYIKPRARAGRR